MYFKPSRTSVTKRLDERTDGSGNKIAPLAAGWFTKDSNTKLGKRRKRFFLLVEHSVHYYIRENDGGLGDEYKGTIELTSSTTIAVPKDKDGKILHIDSRGREWVLEATGSPTLSPKAQIDKWVAALASVLKEVKAKASTRRTTTLSAGTSGDGSALVPDVGSLVGAANVAEQCVRIMHHPASKGWPTSDPSCRFSLEMSGRGGRIFNFFGEDPATAHEWRALFCLVSKCCYGCGERVVSEEATDGASAQCCAVSNAGLLYHFECFHCCECSIDVAAKKRGNAEVVLPTELLSIVGDKVYCNKHVRSRRRQAKDRGEALVEFMNVSYRVLAAGRDLDRFIQAKLRNSAMLLVSTDETDESTGDGGAGSDPGQALDFSRRFTPEELRKVPQAVLVDIMKRLKEKDLDEREATREIRAIVDDDGTFDVLRYLCVGQRHVFAHERGSTPYGDEVLDKSSELCRIRIALGDEDAAQLPNIGVKQFEISSIRPDSFRQLRAVSHIDEGKWRESFFNAPGPNNLLSGGASGCFVVSTPDKQYVLKDMRGSERDVLLAMLPQYLDHIKSFPNTLLTRIIGLYDIKIGDRVTTVVMMTSVLAYHVKLRFHEIYDLKGSFVGRKAGSKRKESIVPAGERSGTLKDLDLRRNIVLHDGAESEMIKTQLNRDTAFLQKLQLMDYSLVLGIHFTDEADWVPPPLPRGPQGWYSVGFMGAGAEPETSALHVLGIIDFLQRWDAKKAMENTLKSSLLGQDKHGISAVNPEEYAKRFQSVLGGRFEAQKATK